MGFITFSLPGLGQLMSSYDRDNLTLHLQWYLESGGGCIVLEIDRIIHLVEGQVTSRISKYSTRRTPESQSALQVKFNQNHDGGGLIQNLKFGGGGGGFRTAKRFGFQYSMIFHTVCIFLSLVPVRTRPLSLSESIPEIQQFGPLFLKPPPPFSGKLA